MPIVDIQIVAAEPDTTAGLATRVAHELGHVFDAAAGHVWVRLSVLAAQAYAENDVVLPATQLPTFVRVLHFDLPPQEIMAAQAAAVSQTVGDAIGRPSSLVHVEFAPAGRGRIAFGGRLAL